MQRTRDRLIYRQQAIEARRLTTGTEDSMFPLWQVVRYEETMAVTRALVDNKRAGVDAGAGAGTAQARL